MAGTKVCHGSFEIGPVTSFRPLESLPCHIVKGGSFAPMQLNITPPSSPPLPMVESKGPLTMKQSCAETGLYITLRESFQGGAMIHV